MGARWMDVWTSVESPEMRSESAVMFVVQNYVRGEQTAAAEEETGVDIKLTGESGKGSV